DGIRVDLVTRVQACALPISKKVGRQRAVRRSLPDALDVLVICLEGGLSLPAGLRRVASELKTAHPLLANELSILLREVQLGQTRSEERRVGKHGRRQAVHDK